jgi:hypothetical protein
MHIRTLASVFALSIGSLALAQQDGTFPPGGPSGQDAPRPGRGGDPAQMVERMMQQDANGDGKLAKDELPGPLAERIFERADTNKDGFVDKAELEAFAKAGGMRGGQGGAGGGQGAGPGGQGAGRAMNLEGAMKQINGAYRALNASAMDASSKAADLDAVQRMQSAIFAAKGGAGSLRMSAAAKAKFGEDKAAFESAFRKAMLETAKLSIELEMAILDGKGADAKALVKKIHDSEESGHALFQAEEGAAGGDTPPADAPRRGRGGRANAPAGSN